MRLSGVGVGRGVVVGVVLRMPEPLAEPLDLESQAEPLDEYRRAVSALGTVATELIGRGRRADGDAQEVLEAQALMARDPALVKDIESRIGEGKTAERAVFEAFLQFQQVFEAIGGYMAGRAADLRDVGQRVIAALRGVPVPGVPQSDSPFVLVAYDLAPADTATLDLNKVLAIVTRDGGPTSHTAILARSKGLVAIVGASGSDALRSGQTVIVDAEGGEIVADPTPDEVREAAARGGRVTEAAPLSAGALADGTPVPLLANLGSPEEAALAVALGAEGVGLCRTEFIFLDARQAPSVEVQRARYVELLSAFPGKKVVVRVLDAGADKRFAWLGHDHEENPALGLRGIRALRENENVLRDQLTALADAQAVTDAELWVMAPMVADLAETRYFVDLGRELGLRTMGVTTEIPSAALLADQIAEFTDFVSVGTNDLTQYTLAADRMLGSVSAYQDPWHPAVLRLVKLIGGAGHAAGKPVGVCGEAAGDPLLAVVFIGLGVTNLSMSAPALADVRAELARHSLDEARRLAALAIAATSAAEARDAVRASLLQHV
jgi:phosphotransferase system enzyme I (PtsI)